MKEKSKYPVHLKHWNVSTAVGYMLSQALRIIQPLSHAFVDVNVALWV